MNAELGGSDAWPFALSPWVGEAVGQGEEETSSFPIPAPRICALPKS